MKGTAMFGTWWHEKMHVMALRIEIMILHLRALMQAREVVSGEGFIISITEKTEQNVNDYFVIALVLDSKLQNSSISFRESRNNQFNFVKD